MRRDWLHQIVKNWGSVIARRGRSLYLPLLLLAIALIGAQPSLGKPLDIAGPGQPSNSQAQVPRAHGAASGPFVGQAARFHVSEPLRSIPASPPIYNPNRRE